MTWGLTSIFSKSSRPIRLLCISWYASSASRRLSYSTKANLMDRINTLDDVPTTVQELTACSRAYEAREYRNERDDHT